MSYVYAIANVFSNCRFLNVSFRFFQRTSVDASNILVGYTFENDDI